MKPPIIQFTLFTKQTSGLRSVNSVFLPGGFIFSQEAIEATGWLKQPDHSCPGQSGLQQDRLLLKYDKILPIKHNYYEPIVKL